MIKQKTILNPFTCQLQKILNSEFIAEKNHTHQLSEIIGLITILNTLSQGTNIQIGGGYFVK